MFFQAHDSVTDSKSQPNGYAAAKIDWMPHDIEAEQALLGGILVNNEAYTKVCAFLRPDHFFEPVHASIYELAAELISAGKQATAITLRTFFETAEPIATDLTVPQYLRRLVVNATAISDTSDYGYIIVEHAARRDCLALLHTAHIRLLDPEVPTEKTLVQLQTDIHGLQERAPPSHAHVRSVAEFSGKAVPLRDLHVAGPCPIPSNDITLCTGDGGTGKSLLAVQLAACTVMGCDWLGQKVRRGPALVISAEDPEDELHRRFHDIAGDLNWPLDQLQRLHFLSLAGEDAVIAKADETNVLRSTPLWHRIMRIVSDMRPVLVVYDTLSDLFAGNENARPQARQFIGMLRALALRHGHAALLLAHPSLSGLTSGSGTSGSTAWSNSVRSRLYLERVIENGSEIDPDARVLTTKKVNYGRSGGELRLMWRNGVFVPDDGTRTDGRELEAEQIFLDLLRDWDATGRKVSPNRSPSFAPTVFAKDARGKRIGKVAFEKAMNRLLKKRLVRIVETGPPSRRTFVLEMAS